MHLLLVILLALPQAAAGQPHTSAAQPGSHGADVGTQVEADVLTDFATRVRAYARLRSELELGVPSAGAKDDPVEITKAERALASRIRAARARARPGDIITLSVGGVLRQRLLMAVDRGTRAAIMEDNPGDCAAHLNADYPEGWVLSTVPPSVLQVLPSLPDDIEFRFVGRQLVLLDSRARVILDRLPDAIPPAHGDKRSCTR